MMPMIPIAADLGEMTLPDPTVRITAKGLAKLHLLLGGSGSFGVLAVTA